jgi:hypothetical protein
LIVKYFRRLLDLELKFCDTSNLVGVEVTSKPSE